MIWCHSCGQDIPEGSSYCPNDGHRAGIPQGKGCEECSGLPPINQHSLQDMCHLCGQKASTGSKYCANDGHRLTVPAGDKCEACLGIMPQKWGRWSEDLTIPQKKLLTEAGWFGRGTGNPQLQGMQASVIDAARASGVSGRNLQRLTQQVSNFSPNDPRLAALANTYNSGAANTLGRAVRGEDDSEVSGIPEKIQTISGVLKFLPVKQGSKSEHLGPVLIDQNGNKYTLYVPGDNPFEHQTLKKFNNRQITIKGELTPRRRFGGGVVAVVRVQEIL